MWRGQRIWSNVFANGWLNNILFMKSKLVKKYRFSNFFCFCIFIYTLDSWIFSHSIQVQMWLSGTTEFITPAFTSQLTLCFTNAIMLLTFQFLILLQFVKYSGEIERNRLLGKKSKRLTRYERNKRWRR